ncbi:enoyl-ACP reductase FabI [bacterium]|nr:enoyl-ACP reductase FabI [bacterium]
MKLLENKRGLVVGVANAHSIAWGISQACHQHGAELAFTYLNESLEKRVRPLAESLNSSLIFPCDVSVDAHLDQLRENVEKWGPLDFVVHAVAFAQRDDLDGRFIDTSREGFRIALDVSAYSLVALARACEPLMRPGGSILALTYYGAEKVVRNYNVMGVAKAALEASVRYLAADMGPQNLRVNAISAGPIKTLSAKGIRDFNDMLKHAAEKAPLQRNVESMEVGKSAVYLLSDLSSGVTGEVHYVDCGYNLMGM